MQDQHARASAVEASLQCSTRERQDQTPREHQGASGTASAYVVVLDKQHGDGDEQRRVDCHRENGTHQTAIASNATPSQQMMQLAGS
jgi:hypothetical protein